MPAFGNLKVNKITIQGKNENDDMRDSSDYSFDVSKDVLQISRKDPSSSKSDILLTISKDGADPIDPSMPSLEDTTITVHKNILAKLNITVDGGIYGDGEVHGGMLHSHSQIEICGHGDPVFETFAAYNSHQIHHAEEMGMSHDDHMIGHRMNDGTICSMFNKNSTFKSQVFNLLGPLLVLEFCVKMQPHHQEAIDTGDVMYKWAVDGGVSHLGFHLSYWQDIDNNKQHFIGTSIIDYVNSKNEYPQDVKDLVNKYKVLYKRVRPGYGTHHYDKSSDSYKEGGSLDYKTSSELNPTSGNFGPRFFIKYWPDYQKMMGDQFYNYDLGPDDVWPHAEVKFLRDMYEQNKAGHMMISSLLSSLNDLQGKKYSALTLKNFTNDSFAAVILVLKDIDTIISTFLGKPLMESSKSKSSVHETIGREYKIYFGEVPFLLREIQRIGMSRRLTYAEAPFKVGGHGHGDGDGDDHEGDGDH